MSEEIDFCRGCPARGEKCPMPHKETDWKKCGHKQELIKNGAWTPPVHTCREHDHLVDCDGTTDTWMCKICGRTIKEPCNFEEDYS